MVKATASFHCPQGRYHYMYLRRLPRWEHALTEEEKDRCLQSIEIGLRRLEKLHENA